MQIGNEARTLALAEHVMILPGTLAVKYHLTQGPVRPYVGAGPALFFFIDERPGDTAKALGASRLKIDNTFGAVLQAGIDVQVNPRGLGVTIDAKRYFMRPATHFYTSAGIEALSTRQRLDPWVLSAGAYARF